MLLSVISPSGDGFPCRMLRVQYVDNAIFPHNRVEQKEDVVEICRVAAQAGHIPASISLTKPHRAPPASGP